MTTPNDPFGSPWNESPWDKANNNNTNDSGFTPYPNSGHPEDSPYFGANFGSNDPYSQYSPYGEQGVPGNGEAPLGVHETMGYTMTQGNPGFTLGQIFKYGFKATFSSAGVWIVLALILGIISAVLGFVIPAAGSLITFAIMPLIYNLTLKQVSGKTISLGSFFDISGSTYGSGLVASLIITLVTTLISIPAIVGFFIFLPEIIAAYEGTGYSEPISSEALLTFLIGFLISVVLLILVMPFTQLYPIAIVDGLSFGDGYRAILTGCKGTYWKMIGTFILIGIIAFFVTIITLGFALIIIMPFMWNAATFMYRSITGGVRPVVA